MVSTKKKIKLQLKRLYICVYVRVTHALDVSSQAPLPCYFSHPLVHLHAAPASDFSTM